MKPSKPDCVVFITCKSLKPEVILRLPLLGTRTEVKRVPIFQFKKIIFTYPKEISETRDYVLCHLLEFFPIPIHQYLDLQLAIIG
jgi:hypothetical protein